MNEQNKFKKEEKYLKTSFDIQKNSSKTIENEQKNIEDRNKRLAEKLKKGRMRGKKMLLEKEVEKIEERNNMKKRIKIFEEKYPINDIYMQYNTKG